MNRLSQGFAPKVPQSLIDPCESTHMHATAPVESAAIENCPVVFDRKGIFPDKVVGEFGDRRRYSKCTSLEHRLAPAAQTLICLNL
jgi:hypothetical protein